MFPTVEIGQLGIKQDIQGEAPDDEDNGDADGIVHVQDQLRKWISGNGSDCPNNIFIFDEVDNMLPGVLDAVKPFLDHYEVWIVIGQ